MAAAKRRQGGKMIAVCSAKGGIGKTVLTVNLAVALCKKNMQVGVLDGDFQFGDVGLALDLQSPFTIKDVVENFDHMELVSFASYLSQHDSGVKVLTAPDQPEYADLVTEKVITAVLGWLREKNDYVLVDTASGLQESNLFLIEQADEVLLTTDLVMPGLKNTKLMLETLTTLGFREKTSVVVNRSTMESVIKASDVPAILGEDENDLFYLPNDFKTVSQSLNIGVPFVVNKGKTEVAKSVFKMAELLTTNHVITTVPSKNKRIFPKMLPNRNAKKEKKR
ncbi:MAG TPA: P-loop NTPase [Bacillales bacterium]|nr:P-loop NTPase [Bacillales bacterium]